MNKAYTVKFLSTVKHGRKENVIIEYIEEVISSNYNSVPTIFESPEEYTYNSNVELNENDIVLIKTISDNSISVGTVVKETTEGIRNTRIILAKIDFGEELKKQRRLARKRRLLNILQEKVKLATMTRNTLEEADKLARHNDVDVANLLEEYRSIKD